MHLLAKHIGKSNDDIERVIARPTYFNPYEAVDFGIIDRVSLLTMSEGGPSEIDFMHLICVLESMQWMIG